MDSGEGSGVRMTVMEGPVVLYQACIQCSSWLSVLGFPGFGAGFLILETWRRCRKGRNGGLVLDGDFRNVIFQ